MGTAISWAMDKLGFSGVGMDCNPKAQDNLPEGARFVVVDSVEDMFAWMCQTGEVDVVISSLPYHQTEEVGTWCVDNGIRYCDLGGRVDVSEAINEWAEKKATKPVFTDLGLAPGWVNILAEKGIKETHGADTIGMYVGGLPTQLHKDKPLQWEHTWSIDGLINEYRDDCIILENGEIKTVKGMSGHESVNFISTPLEAFFTSGGASHTIKSMKERGVKNCYYKTLRYKGHCAIVKFLINECGLEDNELKKIFEQGCRSSGHPDRVLMYVKSKKGRLEWKEYKEIWGDEQFSAMQKATAFPIAAVASMMAEGMLEGDKDQHRDYWTQYPKALTYADVPFEELQSRLDKIGLEDQLSWLDSIL